MMTQVVWLATAGNSAAEAAGNANAGDGGWSPGLWVLGAIVVLGLLVGIWEHFFGPILKEEEGKSSSDQHDMWVPE